MRKLNKLNKNNSIKFLIICLILLLILIISFNYAKEEYFENPEYSGYQFSDISLPPSSIMNGDQYVQTFLSEFDSISGFEIMFGLWARVNTCNLHVTLLKENGDMLYEWNINCAAFKDNTFHKFLMDAPISGLRGQKLLIIMVSDATDGGNAIIPYIGKIQDEDARLTINGDDPEGKSLYFQPIYNRAYGKFLMYGLIMISAFLLLTVSFVLVKKHNVPIHRLWLGIGGSLFILYSAAIPILRVPDETNHFLRAYEISNGHLVASYNDDFSDVGGKFPTGLLEIGNSSGGTHFDVLQNFSDANDSAEEMVFRSYINTAVYSPISYLVQAVGISIARLFSDQTLIMFYTARVLSAIVCFYFVYLALRIAPVGKSVIFLIGCNPMFLHEAISLAPDGVTNSLSVLYLSFVLYLCQKDRQFHKFEIFIIYGLTIWMCSMKLVYAPLCLALFLIPIGCFKSRDRRLMHTIICGLIIITFSLGWLITVHGFSELFATMRNAAGSEGILDLLCHPYHTTMFLFKTLMVDGAGLILDMLGSNLGWYDIKIGNLSSLIWFLILVGCFVFTSTKAQRKAALSCRAILGSIPLACFVLIFFSEYTVWHPVGYEILIGFAGRYFIPMIYPLFLCVSGASVDGLKSNDHQVEWFANYNNGLILIVSALSLYAVGQITFQCFL